MTRDTAIVEQAFCNLISEPQPANSTTNTASSVNNNKCNFVSLIKIFTKKYLNAMAEGVKGPVGWNGVELAV